MTTVSRFASALALTCLALAVCARAQTPPIEVSTDSDNVEFSAQGATRRVHVEVYAPSGELVFETDGADGRSIHWPMVDRRGERVPDGVYLATITVVDAAGKRRKRIEQVTVSSPQPLAQAAPATQEPLDPTGSGAAGRLAKWTSPSSLGNSVLTESAAGNVGVNTVPAAVLHVNKQAQPPPLASNGTNATVLLQTSGGKGGNTTGTTRQIAGAGASISLVGGQGGDAPAGSTNGRGGSITLQPGSAGAGAGTQGLGGNVLIDPSGVGKVAIGTGFAEVPGLTIGNKVPGGQAQLRLYNANGRYGGFNRWTNRLEVMSLDAIGLSAGGIARPHLWIEPNGDVGIGTFPVDTRLHVVGPMTIEGGCCPRLYLGTGNVDFNRSLEVRNSQQEPLFAGLKVGGITISYDDVYTVVPERNNLLVRGQAAIGARNTLSGVGLYVVGTSAGIQAESSGFAAVIGIGNAGVYGQSTVQNGAGIFGAARNISGSIGVYGRAVASNASTYAGVFDGKLQVNGTFVNNSDRNMKANISSVSPRSILRKLATVPIQAWNYKTEGAEVRHLGPMAQDFRAAFGLGVDEKTISAVDADGVALASIQALYEMMLEKDRLIERQGRQIGHLQARLARIERAANKRRPARKAR